MDLRILFWNLDHSQERKHGPVSIEEHVAQACVEADINLLFLAETEQLEQQNLLDRLVAADPAFESIEASSVITRVRLYSRLANSTFKFHGGHGNGWYAFWELSPYADMSVNFVTAHLPSQLYATEDDQVKYVDNFTRRMRGYEKDRGHSRTILVGDLNLDPFHKSVATAVGLNATPAKAVAKRGPRIVDEEAVDFFYNPMWRLYSNAEEMPIGSYYYSKTSPTSRYWHLYDQFLVRPELMDGVKDVKLVTNLGGVPLLTQGKTGRPNRMQASDHLPIQMTITI